MIDDIKAAIKGLEAPKITEQDLGKAEVRQVFDLSKYGIIAGCYVTSGVIKRNAKCRIVRDDIVIHTAQIKALKHYKDDVKEAKNGTECGISFESYTEYKEGDIFECFEEISDK